MALAQFVASRLAIPTARLCFRVIQGMTATTGWMFVPDDSLARIPGADANYLVFGWWLMKDAGGMPDSYGPIAEAIGMVEATVDNTAAAHSQARQLTRAARLASTRFPAPRMTRMRAATSPPWPPSRRISMLT